MESEQTLLCGYGSLAGFAKINMNTWNYPDIVISANNNPTYRTEITRVTRNLDHQYVNNYLAINASSAIRDIYNLENISAANPLGVIGEIYTDYRIMPWIYSIDYNSRFRDLTDFITSGSIFGPLDAASPINIGPGTELPLSYTFSRAGISVSINTTELMAFYDNNLLNILFPDTNSNKISYNDNINLGYKSVLRNINLYSSINDSLSSNINNYSIFGGLGSTSYVGINAYQLYSDTGIVADESDDNPFNGKFKYLISNELSGIINNNIETKSLNLSFTPFQDKYYNVNKNIDFIRFISGLEPQMLSYKYNNLAIEVSNNSIQWGRTEDQIQSLISDTSSSASGMVISESGFAGLLVSDGLTSADNLIAYIDYGMEKPVIQDSLVYTFENNKFIEIGLN